MNKRDERREIRAQIAISGHEDLKSSHIRVEGGYLERERRENLLEQGFDVEEQGFEKSEKTYSWRERLMRQANKDMEETEAKRVNHDPFASVNEDTGMEYDTEKEKEEVMEERGEVQIRTKLAFIEELVMKLRDAKVRVTHGQKYSKSYEFQKEWTRIEVTNNDLEERRIFLLVSKEPLVLNFKPRAGEQVIEVKEGTFGITRDSSKMKVSISINGATRTYETKDSQLWIAENVVVNDEEEEKALKEIDPWAVVPVKG